MSTASDAIIARIASEVSPTDVFDLDNYVSMSDLPDVDQCLLIEFAAASDRISSIGSQGSMGFEEDGTIVIHWLYQRGFNDTYVDGVKTSAESLRTALRGLRISDGLWIESVDPFIAARSPIDEHSRWSAFSAFLNYNLNTCG